MNRNRLQRAAYTLLVCSTIVFTACKDDDDDDTPTPAPTPAPTPTPAAIITFAEPVAHQIYHTGDSVRITGTIVTAAAMHGYKIYIRNHDTNAELFSYNAHGHGTNITFDQSWQNTFTDSTELDVEVSTLLDHDTGIVAGKRITIQTAP